MQQIEGTRITMEDRKELAFQIKELELKVQKQRDWEEPNWIVTMKQLRKLRRTRDAK